MDTCDGDDFINLACCKKLHVGTPTKNNVASYNYTIMYWYIHVCFQSFMTDHASELVLSTCTRTYYK